MKLTKGVIPLYRQLERELRRRISTGLLVPEERFPSERELKTEFGVSSITVRQALQLLENDGLIERRQGLGTFLRKNAEAPFFVELTGSVVDFFSLVQSRRTRIVGKSLVAAGPEARLLTDVREGEEIYLLLGVRALKADNGVKAFLKAYLPRQIGARLAGEEQPGAMMQAVFHAAEEEMGQIWQAASATRASQEAAGFMGVNLHSPILLHRVAGVTTGGRVVCVLYWHMPGDSFQLKTKLSYRRKGAV